MRKLAFLVLAASAAVAATAISAEPSAATLAKAQLIAPTSGAGIGQARSLRSLTLGSYRLAY